MEDNLLVPEKIIELVEKFRSQLSLYKNNTYNELQVREDFINPFFESLGWRVSNTDEKNETLREVVLEGSVKVDGRTKKPDYVFRIDGKEKFFVEAKRPSVSIKDKLSPAIQIRSYGWNAGLTLSIVTDFEEFAVYDTTIRPKNTDRADTARILYIRFDEYIDRWKEIECIFSKDSIKKNSLCKYDKRDNKKGSEPVSSVFLKDIREWRKSLAKNLIKQNDLSESELNFSVQIIIDRIIFLRICEDREIEDSEQLQNCSLTDNIYDNLKDLFIKADHRYNSGLFCLDKRNNIGIDKITPNLKIDDSVLKKIIGRLYYPTPYEFSVMPADILGQIYEQFLGEVIRITSSGDRIKIEGKLENRKSGGVYYTPKYIVDYIVKNTVGEILKTKTLRTIKQFSIIDPASGSGAFLIEAYQVLMDWYLEQYISNKKTTKIYETTSNGWLLKTSTKKQILLDHIYGVDIDKQAVEVTKLSLLLKVLEESNNEMLKLELIQSRILPNLSDNVKCGNSLIGMDFYESQSLGFFKEKEKINCFDWKSNFKEVFDNGGFNCIIGNPPYVNIEKLDKNTKDYLFNNYETCSARTDLYIAFIERSLQLLLKKSGVMSFIIPYSVSNQKYGISLRKMLIEKYFIENIVDTSPYFVFKDATVKTLILKIKKEKEGKENTKINCYNDKENFTENIGEKFNIDQKIFLKLKDFRLETKNIEKLLIIKDQIERETIKLEDIFFIAYGVRVNHKTRPIPKSHYIHKEKNKALKKFVEGRNIKRFVFQLNGWLDYRPGEHYNSMFPELFENEKIMFINVVSDRLRFAYDNQNFYNSHTIVNCVKYDKLKEVSYIQVKRQIRNKDFKLISNYTTKFIIGILNSSLINWYFHKFLSEKLHFYPNDAKQLPIPKLDLSRKGDKEDHDKMVELVEQIILLKKQGGEGTPHEEEILQRKINYIDSEIDSLTNKLYGLDVEEIEIIQKYN